MQEQLINDHGGKTKFEIFLLLTEGIYDITAEQSLLYAQQKNYIDFKCTEKDYSIWHSQVFCCCQSIESIRDRICIGAWIQTLNVLWQEKQCRKIGLWH